LERKVIAVANQKGGCGKTTIATNLACMFAAAGKKTLLVDADTQGSSMNFRDDRPDDVPFFQAVQNTTGSIHKDIGSFDHDIIIIDAGGRDSKAFRSAMFAADHVIFPVVPSQADIASTEQALSLFSELKTTKDDLKGGIVLNMLIPNPRINLDDVDNLLVEIASDYGVKIFETKIHIRLAYRDALASGKSVVEYSGERFDKASEEITNLFKEVNTWK